MATQNDKNTDSGENPNEADGETLDAADIQAKLNATQEALKRANREAAERRKKIEELEAREQKRKEAEMSETDKLSRKLAELERSLEDAHSREQQAQLALIRRDVAARLNVPAILADRLRGETPEEIEADAAELVAKMPKNPSATAANANAGSGAKQPGRAGAEQSMNAFIRAASGRPQ